MPALLGLWLRVGQFRQPRKTYAELALNLNPLLSYIGTDPVRDQSSVIRHEQSLRRTT